MSPLGFYDEQGKATGVAIDIFQHIVQKLELDVDITLGIPGKRVLFMLKEGEADGIPFIRKTRERETFLDYWSGPSLY